MAGRRKREAARLRRAAGILLCIAALWALICLSACSGGGSATAATGGAGGGGAGTASGNDFSPPTEVRMPQVEVADDPGIDVSHVNEGYVTAKATDASRLKFQVSCGDMSYNYDLPNGGTPAVFPVNMGDGSYLFRIMRNTEGSNYVEIMSASADVSLMSEFAPFTIPNAFCNYTPTSASVAKGRELTSGASNQGEAVQSICTFIVDNITYDTDKAVKLSTMTGYVPDPDETLSTGTGICFDYASLAAAMLRSEGFPTKIITGYVGGESIYHAWIMIYVDGEWKTGLFSVNPQTWSRVDVTFAAAGNNEFVGDASAYTDRYVY